MNLSTLPKIISRKSKRVGRGIGSGRGGHTTGRGNKGQKARERVAIQMEGTKWKKSLVKRLPFLRGRNKLKKWGDKPAIIKLGDLREWPVKTEVSLINLIESGLVAKNSKTVKILSDGEPNKGLKVSVQLSRTALEKIEANGGTIVGK